MDFNDYLSKQSVKDGLDLQGDTNPNNNKNNVEKKGGGGFGCFTMILIAIGIEVVIAAVADYLRINKGVSILLGILFVIWIWWKMGRDE